LAKTKQGLVQKGYYISDEDYKKLRLIANELGMRGASELVREAIREGLAKKYGLEPPPESSQ